MSNKEIGDMLLETRRRIEKEKNEEFFWDVIGWKEGLALWLFFGLFTVGCLITIAIVNRL